MGKSSSSKKLVKSIVVCCMDRLLKEAKENYKTHPNRTKRYLSLVLKFIQRYKIKFPREKRLLFCKKCLTYWVKGDTLELKKNSKFKTLDYICKNCGTVKRFPQGKQ